MTELAERLAGRTVLVTGASGGLGANMARLCAQEGARVVLAARRLELVEHLAREVRADGGVALAVPLDVTDEVSVQACYDQIERELGPVNSVIANAGTELSGRATELSVIDFDQVFAVNVRGVFLTAREAARRMQALGSARTGRIILVSSITARTCGSGICAYSASKAAVSHLSRVLAKEWARSGPNVNCISPGYIDTDMTSGWFTSDPGKRHLARFPRRQLVDAAALNEAVVMLLAEASAHITGTDITIDDGQSL